MKQLIKSGNLPLIESTAVLIRTVTKGIIKKAHCIERCLGTSLFNHLRHDLFTNE